MRIIRGLSFEEAAGNMPWSEDGRVLLSNIKDSLLKRRMTGQLVSTLSKTVHHIEENDEHISITILSK